MIPKRCKYSPDPVIVAKFCLQKEENTVLRVYEDAKAFKSLSGVECVESGNFALLEFLTYKDAIDYVGKTKNAYIVTNLPKELGHFMDLK